MSGEPRRWAIRMGAKQYLIATTDHLRDLERSEVLTTPSGVRYVVAGRYRKTRGQLEEDFLYEYARSNNGSERGAWTHLAVKANDSGGASIGCAEVSKWRKGPGGRYPDGSAVDNAIRQAIEEYLTTIR